MTAKNQDFSMNVGETKVIDVGSTEDEDTGGTLDITGFQEITWVMKRKRGGTLLVSKTESGSADVVVTDASVGAYEITLQPEDTEDVIQGQAVYLDENTHLYHRVRLTDGSGRESDLLEGTITLSPA